ncbi:MAG TPA: hypothetical protein VLN26_08305 [Gaiellaceae bacterium]|nr:hypothetical protein [Gaiellaceae bacterium]
MGFFDPPPAEEEPPREEPDWLGPSPGVLGVAVPFAAVLARTSEVALVVAHLTAYPNGFEFRLLLRLRAAGGRADPLFMHPGGGQGADAFHLGVQFADGRKATNVFRPRPGDGPPEQPLLMMRGGGGGPRSWDAGLWVWGLPPSGPLAFVCEWRERGIAESRLELDAQQVLDAAARAEQLWPDE